MNGSTATYAAARLPVLSLCPSVEYRATCWDSDGFQNHIPSLRALQICPIAVSTFLTSAPRCRPDAPRQRPAIRWSTIFSRDARGKASAQAPHRLCVATGMHPGALGARLIALPLCLASACRARSSLGMSATRRPRSSTTW